MWLMGFLIGPGLTCNGSGPQLIWLSGPHIAGDECGTCQWARVPSSCLPRPNEEESELIQEFYSPLYSTLRLGEGDDGYVNDGEGRSWDKDDDNDVARLRAVVAVVRPKPLVIRWLKTNKPEESRYASSTFFFCSFSFSFLFSSFLGFGLRNVDEGVWGFVGWVVRLEMD